MSALGTDRLEALLEEERRSVGEYILGTRVIVLALFAALTVFLIYAPGSHASPTVVPLLTFLTFVAAVWWWVGRRSEAVSRRSWLPVFVIDFPAIFVSNMLHLDSAQAAMTGDHATTMAAAIISVTPCLLLLTLATYALALRGRQLLVVTLVCMLFVTGLSVRAGVTVAIPIFILQIGVMCAVALFGQSPSATSAPKSGASSRSSATR